MIVKICPICSNDKIVDDNSNKKYLRLRNYQKLYTCKKCSHSWRIPLLENDTALNDRYELQKGIVRYSTYTAKSGDELGIPPHLIDRAKKIQSLGGAVLDFGSGDGSFLHYMRSQGIQAWGVDQDTSSLITDDLAQYIKNDVNFFDIKFNFVNANHVLEHILNPIDTLMTLKKYIKPYSVIFIEVPNEIKSLAEIIKSLFGLKSVSATILYEHQHFFFKEVFVNIAYKSWIYT